MTGTPPISLRTVDSDNVRAACALDVSADQRAYVAPVAVSLAQAYVEGDRAWPRLVTAGDELVGFLMLDIGPDVPAEPIFLWRLLIDRHYQGRGYGRAAVGLAVDEVRMRGGTVLQTSYLPGGPGPEGFYRKLGFVPTGEVDGGEVVVELGLE